MESRDETSIRRMAPALVYHHELGEALFADRALEFASGEYAIITGFGTFVATSADSLQSLHNADSVPQQMIGELLELLRLEFHRKHNLRAKESSTL